MEQILNLLTQIEVEIEKLEETRREHLLDAVDRFRSEVKQALNQNPNEDQNEDQD